LNPAKAIGEFNSSIRREETMWEPPQNTRARGRSKAIKYFQEKNLPYIINWDSIALENQDYLPMPDPFHKYQEEVDFFLR
jgi:hypothetical protein